MSHGRKRPGWRAAVRTYNYLTKDLQRKARESVDRPFACLLREALHELKAIHAHHYPDCGGFCPADDIVKRGTELLVKHGMAPVPVGQAK